MQELQEIETGIDDTDKRLKTIPESGRWLASQHGRWRPAGRVRTRDEWEYFDANLLQYMGSSTGEEADNHRNCNFLAFSKDFNLSVSRLGANEKPEVTCSRQLIICKMRMR